MKLLGASLLCLGLMMAESKGSKAKVRYSQPLPTPHKPQLTYLGRGAGQGDKSKLHGLQDLSSLTRD